MSETHFGYSNVDETAKASRVRGVTPAALSAILLHAKRLAA